MRIYILFSDDPIFKPKLLYQILIQLSGKYDFCGVGEVVPPSHGGLIKKIKYNIQFWEIKPFFYIAVNHYFRKILSRFRLPWPINGMFSLRKVSEIFNISFERVKDVNSQEFLKTLSLKRPDIILSFQHQIFKSEILNLPTKACINCHPALLPKYRGIKPIFWAMLNREKFFGVTVHTMTEEIDAGRIISQTKIPIRLEHSLFQNYIAAYEISARVIIDSLFKIESESTETFQRIDSSVGYYKEPTLEDIKEFKNMGLKIF